MKEDDVVDDDDDDEPKMKFFGAMHARPKEWHAKQMR